MNKEFGMKELYDLTLKATYPIEIEGRIFEEGEVIARFDKIQIANFKEITSRISANGGYNNRARVLWEDTKEIQINFTQGIFSRAQLALLSNAKLTKNNSTDIEISQHIATESDGQGAFSLNKENISGLFIYDAKTFEKIRPTSVDYAKGEVTIDQSYRSVEVDFTYLYKNGFSTMTLGQKLIKGFLSLEGKTRVKDDITGKTHTAILRIPRLKLVSDLSMRLGREATPTVANFSAVGLPEGEKNGAMVMELLYLNDDIDADM